MRNNLAGKIGQNSEDRLDQKPLFCYTIRYLEIISNHIEHELGEHKIMANPETYDKYAIFETGGKQYQGVVGKTVAIEKLSGEPGTAVSFDKVLFRKKGSNDFEVGKPHLEGAIKASIVKHIRGPKIIAFRFKRRKKVRVKQGHRQPATVVRIESI